MLSQALSEAIKGLFAICAAVAAMDLLIGHQSSALSFRSLCALSVALCALRLVASLLGAFSQ